MKSERKKQTQFIHLNQETKRHFVFDKQGSYVVFFHNISGEFIFDLAKSGVELEIYGLFTAKQKEIYKIKTVQQHSAPATTSNLLVKGVFEGSARFEYQGLVRIEKKAQKSHAYQKNQNLVLSPSVFVDSRPFLEILANDVFCTHGSTTGSLNKDQLFYLNTRGISDTDAKKVLVEGFITEIYDKIKAKVPDYSVC